MERKSTAGNVHKLWLGTGREVGSDAGPGGNAGTGGEGGYSGKITVLQGS
jgi:hypothetical protein